MSYHRPCIPCSFSTAADCCRVSHVSYVSSPTSGVSFNHPGSFQTGLERGSLTGFARGGAIFDLRQRRNAKDGKDGKVGHVKLNRHVHEECFFNIMLPMQIYLRISDGCLKTFY